LLDVVPAKPNQNRFPTTQEAKDSKAFFGDLNYTLVIISLIFPLCGPALRNILTVRL
jgi:hypothetical protein